MKKNVSGFLGKKENIGQALFFLALIDILAVDHVSATSIPVPFSGRMIQLAILLLGVVVLITHYSLKEWAGIACAAILSMVSFYFTRSYFVCELFLLLIASKNIEKKQIVRIYILLVGGLTILVGIAAISGIFGDVYQSIDFRGNGIETRYCMGYNHPNSYHIILIQLMLALFWLYWEKMKWYHVIGAGICNVIVATLTKSRTNFLLGTILIVLMLMGKIKPVIMQYQKLYLLNYIVLSISLGVSAIAVISGATWKPMEIINRFWTNRIVFAHEAAYYSRITLFSDAALQISCDMGFVKLLYNCGLVIYLIILLLLIIKIYKNYLNKDYMELLCIFAGIIYLLGEKFSSGEFITRNLLFIFMINMWSNHETDKSKEQIS